MEWLAYVARHRDLARLFVLGTYRSAEAIVHSHPVRTVTQELYQQGYGQQLDLDYLTEASVREYLTQRFDDPAMPSSLSRLLHQRTNGNPLFLVTLADEIARQGGLPQLGATQRGGGDAELVGLEIPLSLRHMIERQLEQLAPDEQTRLEAASVAGVEFTAALFYRCHIAEEIVTISATVGALSTTKGRRWPGWLGVTERSVQKSPPTQQVSKGTSVSEYFFFNPARRDEDTRTGHVRLFI